LLPLLDWHLPPNEGEQILQPNSACSGLEASPNPKPMLRLKLSPAELTYLHNCNFGQHPSLVLLGLKQCRKTCCLRRRLNHQALLWKCRLSLGRIIYQFPQTMPIIKAPPDFSSGAFSWIRAAMAFFQCLCVAAV